MVGGNVTAKVVKETKAADRRGVPVQGGYEHLLTVSGWLDYQSGQDSHLTYKAELADTTHLFICDYREDYAGLQGQKGLSLEVNGDRYEALFIDDPMGLHQHIETFLRRVG